MIIEFCWISLQMPSTKILFTVFRGARCCNCSHNVVKQCSSEMYGECVANRRESNSSESEEERLIAGAEYIGKVRDQCGDGVIQWSEN